MMVTQMFNNERNHDQLKNDVNPLMPTDQHNYQPKTADVEETRENTTIFRNLQQKQQQNDVYAYNSKRIEHELNKIRFMFVAVRKIKEFSQSIM